MCFKKEQKIENTIRILDLKPIKNTEKELNVLKNKEEHYNIINFVYKNFLKENFYSNRSNYFAMLFSIKTLQNFFIEFIETYKNEPNKNPLIDFLEATRICVVPSDLENKAFISRKRNKDFRILRNYIYDQTGFYLYSDKDDIIFNKIQNPLKNSLSNGKYYSEFKKISFFPRYYGTEYKKEKPKHIEDNSEQTITNIGIYYKTETEQNEMKTIIDFLKNQDLKNTNVFIMGAYFEKPESLNANKVIQTTLEKEFYSNISKFYYTIPVSPGNCLPNSLVHCVLNNTEVVIVKNNKIMCPLDIYETELTEITSGFLEMNLLFDFNHKYLKEPEKIFNIINTLEKKYKETNNEYYLKVLKTLEYFPNNKNLSNMNLAKVLIDISKKYLIKDFFDYLFTKYQGLDEEDNIIKIKKLLNKNNINYPDYLDYLDTEFTKAQELKINRVKKDILKDYLKDLKLREYNRKN